MNIDISELLALDTAAKAHVHRLPLYVAAFRLFRDIRDHNKIGGLKKELSELYLRYQHKPVCPLTNSFSMSYIITIVVI
jgi:hypothetical protein